MSESFRSSSCTRAAFSNVAAGLADLGVARCAEALLRETAGRARLFPEPSVKTPVAV
ncbi:hypothetical protein [Streptomyces sp. NPDC088350]|uniref:hypothetical protein n=1 Tax=Streptomyces sp. NPDC088350 TaxID=3365854 RepID=UPI003828F9BA